MANTTTKLTKASVTMAATALDAITCDDRDHLRATGPRWRARSRRRNPRIARPRPTGAVGAPGADGPESRPTINGSSSSSRARARRVAASAASSHRNSCPWDAQKTPSDGRCLHQMPDSGSRARQCVANERPYIQSFKRLSPRGGSAFRAIATGGVTVFSPSLRGDPSRPCRPRRVVRTPGQSATTPACVNTVASRPGRGRSGAPRGPICGTSPAQPSLGVNVTCWAQC